MRQLWEAFASFCDQAATTTGSPDMRMIAGGIRQLLQTPEFGSGGPAALRPLPDDGPPLTEAELTRNAKASDQSIFIEDPVARVRALIEAEPYYLRPGDKRALRAVLARLAACEKERSDERGG